MVNPESLEGLVRAVRAEADQLVLVIRSAFGVPPTIPPKERLERFARARRAANVLLDLRHSLEVLQQAVETGEEARTRFVRAMRERGVITDS